MRLIIAGGRDFIDYEALKSRVLKELKKLCKNEVYAGSPLEIVGGEAPGADTLGKEFAKEFGIPFVAFPAKWNNLAAVPCAIGIRKDGSEYNKLAGHNRNQEMADYASEELGVLIAFWDDKSSGTKDMISRARGRHLHVIVVGY